MQAQCRCARILPGARRGLQARSWLWGRGSDDANHERFDAGNGVWLLLAIMLVSAVLGLLAALYVRWIDMREGVPPRRLSR